MGRTRPAGQDGPAQRTPSYLPGAYEVLQELDQVAVNTADARLANGSFSPARVFPGPKSALFRSHLFLVAHKSVCCSHYVLIIT